MLSFTLIGLQECLEAGSGYHSRIALPDSFTYSFHSHELFNNAVFLQVRCMVAILILVGKGQEDAEIVQRMLDIDTFGNKPQYNFADEVRA